MKTLDTTCQPFQFDCRHKYGQEAIEARLDEASVEKNRNIALEKTHFGR